jgi:hypothetical protein
VSAPDPPVTSRTPLLVVIDPAARHVDGESVRIARDVLCAGAAGAKVCLPDGPEETERILARRGSRRPVVVGDDRALLRAVTLLHRERDLGGAELSVIPVGSAANVALTRELGVPPDAVLAARAALGGVGRRLDLLIDDSGGVVLGGLRIPDLPDGYDGRDAVGGGQTHGASGANGLLGAYGPYGPYGARGAYGPDGRDEREGREGRDRRESRDGEGRDAVARYLGAPSRRAKESLARPLRAVRQLRGGERNAPAFPGQRLRVEADGELLADLDRPVREVSVSPDERQRGLAEVTVRPVVRPGERGETDGAAEVVRARARAVTVSGPDFHYRADAVVGGPVRVRTWTVLAGAWTLTLPG